MSNLECLRVCIHREIKIRDESRALRIRVVGIQHDCVLRTSSLTPKHFSFEWKRQNEMKILCCCLFFLTSPSSSLWCMSSSWCRFKFIVKIDFLSGERGRGKLNLMFFIYFILNLCKKLCTNLIWKVCSEKIIIFPSSRSHFSSVSVMNLASLFWKSN